MTVDVVAIGAHPDDVELIIGGTIAKLIDRGKSVAVIDMTRGEMATRGTPEIREKEAQQAADILGVTKRINLNLPDGRLENNEQNRIKIIEQIRLLRPTLVFAHHWNDLHPDHVATANIVRDTMYTTGFTNYPAKGAPYRPNEYLFFMSHLTFTPSFIVDTSDYHDKKLQAVNCFKSQLNNPDSAEPPTGISQPHFIERVTARARHFGSLIQTRYGEPFFVRRPVPIDDPVDLYKPFPKL